MKILNPSVEFLSKGDNSISHVAKCARVCYNKETGDDKKTYNNLINSKHWSVFRHATHYALLVLDDSNYDNGVEILDYLNNYFSYSPYIKWKNIWEDKIFKYLCIVTNGNFLLDHTGEYIESIMKKYSCSAEEFFKYAPELMRYTFKIVTQDSTAKELNRVSPNNITEMSTRYVDLKDGAICKPHWMKDEIVDQYIGIGSLSELPQKDCIYLSACSSAFLYYKNLIEDYKFKKEDARGVLPKDTATTVIYTYSIKEWRHIIELRIDKRAHPNARIIANMIKEELEKQGYKI